MTLETWYKVAKRFKDGFHYYNFPIKSLYTNIVFGILFGFYEWKCSLINGLHSLIIPGEQSWWIFKMKEFYIT